MKKTDHSKLIRIGFSSFLACLTMLAGCSDPETTKQRHLEQGRVYLKAGNYDKARVEFKNVLQITPNAAEAYYLLGQVEEARKELLKSLPYYLRAVELKPELLDAHVRLGYFYLLKAGAMKEREDTVLEMQALEKVQKRIDIVLGQSSGHTNALVLQSSLMIYRGEIDTAVDTLLEVLRVVPAHEDAILLLAWIYREQNRLDDAVHVLLEGISVLPSKLPLQLELFKLYSSLGQNKEAVSVMQDIIQQDPINFGYRASLAAFYVKLDELELAEKVFRAAIDLVPDDNNRYLAFAEFLNRQKGVQVAMEYLREVFTARPEAYDIGFRLAHYHQVIGEAGQAIIIYENIVTRWGIDLPGIDARKRLAVLYFQQGELKQVKRLAAEVLEEHQHDYEALILLGKVLLQGGDYEKAVVSFRSALKSQPDSLEILNLLAESHLRNGEIELAADTFSRATEVAPHDKKARLQFARFLLAAKKTDQALKQVETILTRDNENVDALVMKSEILMAAGKIPEVIAVVDEIKRVAPDNDEGWFRRGRIYNFYKQYNLAHEEFVVAWEKTSESEDLLAELTDLEIKLGETDMARERLETLLTERPDHPVARKFLGMVHMVEMDFTASAEAFNKHLEVSPEDIPVYLQLATAYYKSGKLNQAAFTYRQGLKRDPHNLRMKTGLAVVLELKGDYDGAVRQYEDVLQVEPKNVVSANNLALILVNRIGDTKSLLRAKRLVQDVNFVQHPAILDTLGWVHYKLGEYKEAVTILKQAVTKMPVVPVFHYHLGIIYHDSGDEILAQKHLRRALALGKFPGMQNAHKVLAEIGRGA